MIDFIKIHVEPPKKKDAPVLIYPKFLVRKSSDLMIRGRDFYAVWIEEKGLWSTDEQDALDLIDREVQQYYNANKHKWTEAHVLYLWDSTSGMIDRWHKYCQQQMRDNFHMLDEKLIFSNTNPKKEDYASNGSKGLIKAGASLVLIAEAVKILADAMVKMSDLSWEEIGKGLTALGGGLLELSVALKIINGTKVSLSTSVAMIALAEACKALIQAECRHIYLA